MTLFIGRTGGSAPDAPVKSELAPRGTPLDEIVAWVESIAARRDLSVPAPDHKLCAAIEVLLGVFAAEFGAYREVVAGARDAATKNAAQLQAIVRSANQQGVLVRSTAQAASEAGNSAARLAEAAQALREFAQAAAVSATEAGRNVARVHDALGELGQRLADNDPPLTEMRGSTAGVGDFLVTLARLARNAQLLAVNASIEAAYLAEAGPRFAIVANEIRSLSVSTRESRKDVARIVAELGTAIGHIGSATTESKTGTTAARGEVAGAAAALSRTGRSITDFEDLVTNVADFSGTQSMAVQAISQSIEQIAHHAEEAAGASHAAAALDLNALLERAQDRAGRWKMRTVDGPAPKLAGDMFSSWIGSLVTGADVEVASAVDSDPDLHTLAVAVRALTVCVNAEQRDILACVVAVAVAVSHNGYAWRSISESLESVRREIEVVRETVDQTAAGVREVLELGTRMRRVMDVMSEHYNGALRLLDEALSRISRIGTSVGSINDLVGVMSSAAARVDNIMALIDSLSSETTLLSLNAAIEAAHAGELGRGFGVIADEIRSLARSTDDSTLTVTELVANIARISSQLQVSIGEAATSMETVVSSADGARRAIATLQSAFDSAIKRAADVSATSSEQCTSLDGVLANINRSDTSAHAGMGGAESGRMQLASVGSRAHEIAARRPIGTVIERVRALALSLCERLEAKIETAVATGVVPLDRLFSLTYTPIEGDAIAKLGRLFDVSQVPTRGFAPPKFATPWDSAIDEVMIGILSQGWEEAMAAALSPVTIFVSDLNGLFYAYPRQKIAAWTNDPSRDSVGNRIKRLFEDEYALRVGRYGLGPNAGALGPRTSYDQFRAAGCELTRPVSRPWGGFVYARDTSLVCNEVVMAIYVDAKRHSTLRLCYDPTLI